MPAISHFDALLQSHGPVTDALYSFEPGMAEASQLPTPTGIFLHMGEGEQFVIRQELDEAGRVAEFGMLDSPQSKTRRVWGEDELEHTDILECGHTRSVYWSNEGELIIVDEHDKDPVISTFVRGADGNDVVRIASSEGLYVVTRSSDGRLMSEQFMPLEFVMQLPNVFTSWPATGPQPYRYEWEYDSRGSLKRSVTTKTAVAHKTRPEDVTAQESYVHDSPEHLTVFNSEANGDMNGLITHEYDSKGRLEVVSILDFSSGFPNQNVVELSYE